MLWGTSPCCWIPGLRSPRHHSRGEPPDLSADEALSIVNAVPRRCLEFATGRECASGQMILSAASRHGHVPRLPLWRGDVQGLRRGVELEPARCATARVGARSPDWLARYGMARCRASRPVPRSALVHYAPLRPQPGRRRNPQTALLEELGRYMQTLAWQLVTTYGQRANLRRAARHGGVPIFDAERRLPGLCSLPARHRDIVPHSSAGSTPILVGATIPTHVIPTTHSLHPGMKSAAELVCDLARDRFVSRLLGNAQSRVVLRERR